MSTTRVKIDPRDPVTLPGGRIDPAVVDGAEEAARALRRVLDKAPEAVLRVLT